MKIHRYDFGGYAGDQLPPLVEAIMRDADQHPLGREPLREVVQALVAELHMLPTCAWSLDDIGGDSVWETQCGHSFEWTTDGPRENGAKFCCYCGGVLVEVFTSAEES